MQKGGGYDSGQGKVMEWPLLGPASAPNSVCICCPRHCINISNEPIERLKSVKLMQFLRKGDPEDGCSVSMGHGRRK